MSGAQPGDTYAEIEGVSAEQHVLDTYGSMLLPGQFGEHAAEFLTDPRYSSGVAYGIRASDGIVPLDI